MPPTDQIAPTETTDTAETSGPDTSSPDTSSPDTSNTANPAAVQRVLDRLNATQHAAVTHGEGPALVVAGAGSGKTRVLTRRIAYLIEAQQVNPYHVLAITFTNKAADEMRERVSDLVGPIAKRMWISTFHKACVQMLRRDSQVLGYPNNFTIYDQNDSSRLVRDTIRELDFDTQLFPYRKLQQQISACKNLLQSPGFVAENIKGRNDEVLASVYAEYQQRLKRAAAMDFDDLLAQTVTLLHADERVRSHYQSAFAHILVDEYQDTNAAQNELVRLLGQKHRNVFVVGDSDQSIYAFRGADIGNINRFDRAFGEDCATYVLEQNYRSTQVVLNAANFLIANNVGRVSKSLWTDSGEGAPLNLYRGDDAYDEARFIAREIQRLCDNDSSHSASGTLSSGTLSLGNTAPGDIAIFYRSNVQSRIIEEIFLEEGLPYKVVGGTRFYDRKEVRDALGFLRCAANPADVMAIKRVINLPARGIGKTSLEKIDRYANQEANQEASQESSYLQALENATEAGIKGKPAKGIADFVALHKQLCDLLPSGPQAVIEYALKESGYYAALEAEDTDEARDRIENLDELLISASGFETCDQLLEQVALVNDTDELPAGGAVSLMTLHAAKGLEYPVVFYTGLEEMLSPHFRSLAEPESLEEERRLAYVGITRAEQRLYLTHADQRIIHGQLAYQQRSRFVAEILSQLDPDQVDDRSDYVIGSGRGRNWS